MQALALEVVEAAEDLADHCEARPLEHLRWTPPQQSLLVEQSLRALLRTGNQFGKTWAGLAEVIYRCLGRHPFKRVRPAPIEAWIITTSWPQSLAIQGKLWALLPKEELVVGTEFDPVTGFRGLNPVVEFRNGSIIRIKTSGQGGLNLASATIHFVLADEPLPSARIYQEVERRLMRTGGALFQTMTPVNAPVDWVRDLVDEGKIRDLHFKMEPANFIPVGSSRPLTVELDTGEVVPMDAAWIERQRASVLSYEAPVILDGEWEFRAVERVFENFRPDLHVVRDLLRSAVAPRGEVQLALGLDYGEEALRTCGVEVYVDASSGEHPRVYVVGEYAPETATTTDMDAEGVLAMLARNGDTWSSLDHAHGDKRYTDASGRITKKSNKDMLAAIERRLQVAAGLRPQLRGAKRGAGRGTGAKWRGIRWINEAMLRPGHFYVDASCAWLIHALQTWKGGDAELEKDILDALRYALTPWILPRRGGVRGATTTETRMYGRGAHGR